MADEQKQNPSEADSAAAFERQRRVKLALLAVIGACAVAFLIWKMFSPAPAEQKDGAAGINTTVPEGKAQKIEGDKQKASEQLRSEEQQNKRMATLGDNSFSLLDDGLKPAEERSEEHTSELQSH